MNVKHIIAALAFGFAGSAAMADDITVVKDNFVSTKTRAEVKAEVLKARAAGVLQFATETQSNVQGQVDVPVVQAAQPLTRAAVRAQAIKGPHIQAGEFGSAA